MARRLLTACIIAAAGLAIVAPTEATTGLGAGYPPPKIKVSSSDAGPFVGRFHLAEIPRAANITRGQILVDFTELPPAYLIGNVQFNAYDAEGRNSTWTANLYPFRYSAPTKTLAAPLLSQASEKRLGELTLNRPTNLRQLVTGKLEVDGRDYPVKLRRVDDDAGPDLPRAKLTGGATLAAQKPTKAGWGPKETTALGRYRLAEEVADAGAGAGVFAPVVRAAQSVASDGPPVPTSAQLTVFTYQPNPRTPPAPAGILTLHSNGTTEVVYLTDLKWGGDARAATVHGGSFEGTKLGTFTGTASGENLNGTLRLDDGRTSLKLTRFSTDPKP